MKRMLASSVNPEDTESGRNQETWSIEFIPLYGRLKHLVYLMGCLGYIHFRENWRINTRIQHLSIFYMSFMCLCFLHRASYHSITFALNIKIAAEQFGFSSIITLLIVDFGFYVVDAYNALLIYTLWVVLGIYISEETGKLIPGFNICLLSI